ncbi:MAG: low molecular weight phosphotyrosine protein phosphatase [Duncaniella sp.]|nr:low molecular weight phosphotyrosine protein phosphatase [Duncaniella sp.]
MLNQDDKKKVLFVCLGNICRSPAAQGIMQTIVDEAGESCGWLIDSAGCGNYHTGDLPDHRMRLHARRRGLELTHRARQVRETDFDDFDMIIGMDDANVSHLRTLAPTPEAEAKVHAMSEFFDRSARYDYVPDPYYEGAEGFELVLDLLMDGCRNLYNKISEKK